MYLFKSIWPAVLFYKRVLQRKIKRPPFPAAVVAPERAVPAKLVLVMRSLQAAVGYTDYLCITLKFDMQAENGGVVMVEDKTRVLGLDIGPNSIGWAIIEYKQPLKKNDPQAVSLVATNVRIFAEGVSRTPQGTEQSKNAARRAARSMRRTHQRRNRRRVTLKNALQEAGLLPLDDEQFSSLMLEDPYRLRAEGLDNKISLYGFGRLLYHFAQRRGFKSNRKSENKKEDGKVSQGVKTLGHEISEAGCRTLGEFLYKSKTTGAPVRFRHIESAVPDREMYEREFNFLWSTQSAFYPDKLSADVYKNAHAAIFFQRPFDIRERWGKNLERLPEKANARRAPELGRCEYEPSERRSPRASWWAQRFRVLQDINNLQVVDTSSGEIRDLTVEERAALLGSLGQKKEMSFDQIRKLLRLDDSCRFNLEGGKRTKLKGNSTEWNLRLSFKNGYDELSEDVRDAVVSAVLQEENEDVLVAMAVNEWKLDEKGAKRLASSTLEDGYLNLSERALKRLVPHLEEGWDYMKAVELAGYQRRDQRAVLASGHLGMDDLPNVTNPLVSSALFQVRKVVNGLIETYGTPSKIRVELVRELKNSRERRQEIIWEQRQNEKRNEDAVKRLEEDFGIKNPKPDHVLRYKLWEECGHECPYTGRTIPENALFSGSIEVEHIIPYSRSLDDSYMNKTLCFTGENRIKEDRTPFEFYGHDEKRWDEILRRAKKLPEKKRDRFYLQEVPCDFINRQLTDTAYIAREMRSFLEKVSGKNNVQVAVGQSTAIIRKLWGLNTVLGMSGEKNRADHRHHAIDAIVVALTTPVLLKDLSKASARKSRIKEIPLPWEGFRDEVKAKISEIVVSHRVRRKVSGSLHEETNYGILKKKDRKGQSLYAVRKSILALTRNEITLIADERVREIVREHLIKHGVDPEKGNEKDAAWKKAMDPGNPPSLPNRNGPPIPIKRVRLHKPASGMIHLGYRAVEPGSNHHIVIYEYTDGKKKGRWDGDVVSMFEAARRLKDKEPVIKRDLGMEKSFVMSLSKNEVVRIGEGAAARYFRVQKIRADDKRIQLREHKAATTDDKEEQILKHPDALRILKMKKVMIDPIGRITPAND